MKIDKKWFFSDMTMIIVLFDKDMMKNSTIKIKINWDSNFMKDFAATLSILSSFRDQVFVNRNWNLDSELVSWRSDWIQTDIKDCRERQLNCLCNFEIDSFHNKLESLNLTMLLVEKSLMMNFRLWFEIRIRRKFKFKFRWRSFRNFRKKYQS